MDLSKVLTIAGKAGLFVVVSQSKTGLIVESLTDGKKMPVFATHQTSSLDDISLFTYSEDVPLREVLWKIHEKENGQPAIDPKSSPNELRSYMEAVLPEYDKERVYTSDIKKLLTWYNILLEKGMITKPEEEEKETPAEDQQQPAEEKSTDKKTKPDQKDNKKKS